MLTVEEMKDLKGKKVLVRVDFNVPQTAGVIRDDNRIQKALPTIQYLTSHGARVILMSHLGKIKWKEPDPAKIEAMKKANDMACVATRLGELVAPTKVVFSPETRGEGLKAKVDALQDGEILLVQNTRYEKGEEKNCPELSKEWASLADAFVMDAFGSAHRAHASTVGVPAILKAEGKQVAEGYLMQVEVKNLSRCVEVADEDRPYVAILGGFKVSDKIKVIDSLLKKCDYVLIGGAMAYTFEKAIGLNVGKSPVETEQLEYALKCLKESNGRLLLPIDAVITDNFDENAERVIKTVDTIVELGEGIPDGFEGVDIGPKTRAKYAEIISKAKMVFWNGPMGVFEQKDFQAGTIAVCEAIKDLEGKAFSVIGGGASLEMIETDGHLPGVDVLR